MSARETIGVDLGGTKMAVGVVDSEQHIHYEGNEPSIGLTEDELVVDLGRELGEARDARPDVLAAGLGIPATIDHDRGVAIQAVNLEISDVPLRDLMSKQLGLPVYMDNDANVAAFAEFLFGAGRGARNVVMLTIGTGIGGGLILDGEIYRGIDRRRCRAGPHRRRGGRPALPGQLPEPRLRRDASRRARRSPGRGRRRPSASRIRRSARRSPRGRSSARP